MLLFSSSIISTWKFMLIPSNFRRSAVQILSFLFIGYTVAVSYSFGSLALVSCLSTYKVLIVFLVPLFQRSALNFVHLCSILSFKIVQPLKVLWFHSSVKEATLSYPFLFRFYPVISLGSRVEILCQCGRVVTPETDVPEDPRRFQKIPEDSRCSGLPVCFF